MDVLKNKTLVLTATIVVSALFVAYLFRGQGEAATSSAIPHASGTIAFPVTQQKIDTFISLSPSTTAAINPSIISPQSVSTQTGCRLGLTFTEISGDPSSGGLMVYSLQVKSLGGAACTSTSLSIYYGTNEKYVGATPQATQGAYWNLGSLDPGKEVDIVLSTNRSAPLGPTDLTNEACVAATNGAAACANSAAPQTTVVVPAASQTFFTPKDNEEFGAWIWTPIETMSQAAMQKTVNVAEANHFTALYISLDGYLTIAAMPAGQAKQARLVQYEQAITNFLSLASQKGIAVDAEAGSRSWGKMQNHSKASDFLDFISSYNASHAVNFRGVQFDIEPYLLSDYGTNQSGDLTEYIELVDMLVQQDKVVGLPLSIVIPHFFDDEMRWTPEITVGGITDYPYNHLLRLLGEVPKSRVLVMAYRNFAAGPDGAVSLAQAEVTEAKNNVKVIIAQETGATNPSYVTFYGESRNQLFTQFAAINQAFSANSSFGGLAVDYLDAFLNLQ